MNSNPSKIKIESNEGCVFISDRMPLLFKEIVVFILGCYSLSFFLFGQIGIVHASIISFGYLLFRFFAWVFWKKIELNNTNKKVILHQMLFTKVKKTKVYLGIYEKSDLSLREFEQSGMKRAMIEYQNHEINQLLLLTNVKDIELVKKEIFNQSNTQIS
ncbi:hypothetical protein SAMN06298216_0366 [Spirosomataceae bacterium TFI 002]|nr:hypothetical protein SAMN06298216_0366 [Spirosomataceae bacterium TFI 002]